MGGGGGVVVCFSLILVKTIFFVCVEKYPQVCERCVPTRKIVMGGTKGMGGEV